ncbi:DUF6524 family protein [Lentibacter sp.]|uniref:DUF6524 family protein n=1 Tax=Lentibacter sp. TaxID=2024994 RepID=UPI003F6A5622
MSFMLRVLAAFGLLTATYNPTSYNFTRWAQTSWSAQTALVVLFGLLLFVGYIIYLRATLRSIGIFGMSLVLALVGALLWVLADFGWLSFEDPTVNTWLAIVALSLVLGVGLSWSHVRRALSGQADMDDVDE